MVYRGDDKMKHLFLILLLCIPSMGLSLEPDKKMHLSGGAILSEAVYATTKDKKTALLTTVAVGIGWELLSVATGKGTPEVNDAIATIVGGGLALTTIDIPLKKVVKTEPASMEYFNWLQERRKARQDEK